MSVSISHGYIKSATDAQPRPLTHGEAVAVFAAMAARADEIAFRYIQEGCECRAQLMIEAMREAGIDPGRAWAVALGRPLAVAPNLAKPRVTLKWGNHTAPTVVVEGEPPTALVIDPAMPGATGPLPLEEWAGRMKARAIEVSEVPLSQAQMLELQCQRALAGRDLDAVIFHLQTGLAPVPEKGGSGFVIGPDPVEGVSAYSRRKMIEYLAEQPGLPGQS